VIEITISKSGTISAKGLIPGQVVFLTLPSGACYRITRHGIDSSVCVEKEKEHENP
jgi:hypothetical protein